MRKIQMAIIALFVCFVAAAAQAMFMRNDTEKVPLERVITNLTARIQQQTNDVELRYALARSYSMAYAMKTNQVDAVRLKKDKATGQFKIWRDNFNRNFPKPPAKVHLARDEQQMEEAKKHLRLAIENYRLALSLDREHLPSQLGFAWCLDQSGDKASALKEYRRALDQAEEQNGLKEAHFGKSMIEEIADYMQPLLDPKKDAGEIKRINAMRNGAFLPRAVTPILIPLSQDAVLENLIDESAEVLFDLDGSGIPQRWQWITPKAGWLVYDHDGKGKITSGLQMFGSVTFWIFWTNGYRAMASLDNDGDGVLRGEELNHLAIWQDANRNGISEPGEVRSLAQWGIVALQYHDEEHATGIPFCREGVVLDDGSTRPSFDWIMHQENCPR